MTLEEYRNRYSPQENLPGWEAIDEKLQQVYGELLPQHYAPEIYFHQGGTDPLDGVNVFNNVNQEPHLHFISYGMSDLYYNENYLSNEFSKWGFEFSFRLKPFAADQGNSQWVINLMNNLARHVFQSGNHFEVFHFVDGQGPIRLQCQSDICGLVFYIDPELGEIQTPHGKVSFLQMVGITSKELKKIYKSPNEKTVQKIIEEIQTENPLLITDLNRK